MDGARPELSEKSLVHAKNPIVRVGPSRQAPLPQAAARNAFIAEVCGNNHAKARKINCNLHKHGILPARTLCGGADEPMKNKVDATLLT